MDYKNFDSTNHTATVMFSVAADRSQSLGSVDIPASVEKDGVTYDVTAVAEYGFAGCTGITTIKLPPTITSIGANAFSGCSTPTKLYLTSANVPSIGTDALVSGLKILVTEAGYDNIYTALGGSYTIEKLKEISYKTVSGMPLAVGTGNLKGTTDCYVYYSGKQGTIVYEGDITEIDYSAFKENTDLQEIEFKASVGGLANGCFSGCTALTTAVLPEGISALPINTFNGCTSLTSVKLPEGITKINSGAFENCTSLKTLVVPEKVTSISYDAFVQCTSSGFNLIMLPSSAPRIDFGGIINADNKFKGFTPYKVSVHQNAKTAYSNDAFWSQFNTFHDIPFIKYLTLNNAVETLDKDADFGTPVISHYYNSTDKYCYLEFAEEPKIGANAFKGFDQLDCLIDMPTGLTSIGASAFEGCTKLRHFQVPTTVKTIGADAFKDCTGLNDLTYTGTLADWCEITFGNEKANPMICMAAGTGNVKDSENAAIIPTELTITDNSVKPYTFVNSNITSLNLGSVTEIGNGSFKGCSSLATITVSTDEPATLGENAFEGINEDHAVKVPLNSYLTYKGTDGWKTLNLTPKAGEITLADAEAYQIDKTVEGCDISYQRTFKNDSWQALFVPFAMTYDDWKDLGTVAELVSVDEDGTLVWEIVEDKEDPSDPTQTIQGKTLAGHPYIFKPKFDEGATSGELTFNVSGALVSNETKYSVEPVTTGDTELSGYTLSGTYAVKDDMASTHAYALSAGNFYYTNDDEKTLKPYRIFLTVPEAQNPTKAPVRSRINGEDVTAIEGLTIDGLTIDDCLYNLHGVRVADSYKGIVIVNGKKVLRK